MVMGIRKQVFLTTTAFALSASLLAGGASAASGFTDIEQSGAKEKIEALYDKGIVKGVTATTFQPESELNVSQGVSLIVRGLELSLAAVDFNTAPDAHGLFPNVESDAWYAESFVNAYYNGVELSPDVNPSASMTREQFLHYLVQGMESTGQYPLIKMFIPITDESSIETDYQGTIQRALLYKIASLDDEGNFNPKSVVTREEAAEWLYNAIEFVEAHREAAEMAEDQPAE